MLRGRAKGKQVLTRVVRNQCTFELANDCTLFPPLISFVQEHATRFGLFDQTDRVRLGIALEEVPAMRSIMAIWKSNRA